ncbi:MAG TPA: diacylglycerol kinase family protein [Clostridia bacterium]|nr:diacylglycerol kinase family protein [Clostridia bacterium]
MKSLAKSFAFAWRGFLYCLKNERNMRIHFVIMIYMYSFLFLFDFFTLTRVEIAIIFIANTIVFTSELFNTAIESTINLVEKRIHKLAKIAKDTAAASVLVGAFFAFAIGIVLLWQPDAFRAMFDYYKTNIFMLVAFVLSLFVSIIFIFCEPDTKNERKPRNRKVKK